MEDPGASRNFVCVCVYIYIYTQTHIYIYIYTVVSVTYVKGVQSKSKLQHTETRSAAAWQPRRLCYRSAVFFHHHLIALSFLQEEKIETRFKNIFISTFLSLIFKVPPSSKPRYIRTLSVSSSVCYSSAYTLASMTSQNFVSRPSDWFEIGTYVTFSESRRHVKQNNTYG